MSVIRGFILLLLVGLWPSCIVAQQSSGPYTFEWEVVAGQHPGHGDRAVVCQIGEPY